MDAAEAYICSREHSVNLEAVILAQCFLSYAQTGSIQRSVVSILAFGQIRRELELQHFDIRALLQLLLDV